MQATDVSVINNYSEGEVIKDMFEIKRANEILLSENDVTQDVLDKLASGAIDDAAISVIKQTAESVVTTLK